MTDMPSSYETSQTTSTSRNTGGGDISLRIEYVKTIPGILKILEVLFSILTFICASVTRGFIDHGGVWVQLVSMIAFLVTLALFLFYLFGVIYKIPGPVVLIEFIYYCVFTLFFLIAAIVAAARASWHGSIVAACIFAFAATAVFAVDTFLQYRAWRSGQTEMISTTTTHTTTTTTTNVEASKEVY